MGDFLDPAELVSHKTDWLFYKIHQIQMLATGVNQLSGGTDRPCQNSILLCAPFAETGVTVNEADQLLAFNQVKVKGSLAIHRTAPHRMLTVKPLIPFSKTSADWGTPNGYVPTDKFDLPFSFGWVGVKGPFNDNASPGDHIQLWGLLRADIEFLGSA